MIAASGRDRSIAGRSGAFHVLVVTLLVLVLVIACDAPGTATPTVDPGTGIRGVVTLGPTCPVEEPGGEPCVTPYAATLIVRRAEDDRELARVTSGGDGRFEVTVPPGDYVILPQNKDPFPFAQPVPVTVTAGRFAEVEVSYDTGVR